jgi:drug/metabolite transporter (DMT)-like permease
MLRRRMSRPSPFRVHAALFTVALMFSANYVISKLGMRELAPLSFAWIRVASAAVLLSLLGGWRGERLQRGDGKRVALYALLGVAINTTLFLSGLALTSVQVAAVLIGTIPVFALGAAIALKQEQATAAKIGGIALAAAGALLVVGGETFHGTRHSLLGAVMVVANCLSYALYLVLSKPIMVRVSARAVITRMFSLGALMILPFAAWPLAHEHWATISPRAWLALGAVIIGPTVIAYLLQAWALRHAESSFVAVYTYVQPILATILGAIFLGEQIRAVVIVAAALIFAGVWLAGRSAQVG